MGALWHVRGSFIKTVYNEGLSPNSGCVKTALNSIKIILTTKTSRQTLPSAVGQSRQSEREGSCRARAGLGGSAGSSKEHITGLLITAENAVATAEFLLLSVPSLIKMQALNPAVGRWLSRSLLHFFLACEQRHCLPLQQAICSRILHSKQPWETDGLSPDTEQWQGLFTIHSVKITPPSVEEGRYCPV